MENPKIINQENSNSEEKECQDFWDVFMRKILQLSTVEDDFNTYGSVRPSVDAIITTITFILPSLKALDLRPCHVAPSAENGVGICWLKDKKYADIEIFNSGEIIGGWFKYHSYHDAAIMEIKSLADLEKFLEIINNFLNS